MDADEKHIKEKFMHTSKQRGIKRFKTQVNG